MSDSSNPCDPVFLSESPDEARAKHGRRAIERKHMIKIFVILPVLVYIALLVGAPMSFNVRQGSLTYQLVGATSNIGIVEFSLGPAGVIKFHTDKTPVNVMMNLVLNQNLTSGRSVTATLDSDIHDFKTDAWRAFKWFILVKILLLVVLGMLAGVLVSNSSEHWLRKTIRNMLAGGLVVTILVAALAGITWATLDKSPRVTYAGLATDLPNVIDLTEKISGNYPIASDSFNTLMRGARVEELQAHNTANISKGPSRIRILAFSDIHDNQDGMELANDILHGVLKPFQAILMAGDITNAGASWEASWMASYLKPGKVPVYLVGGNHENAPAMRKFQSIGYQSINMKEISVDGLEILGSDDPEASSSSLAPNQTLLQQNSQQILELWNSLAQRPQVLVVHEIAQAHGVISEAKKQGWPLTVVYGHDHLVGIQREGNITLVDCGTGGASGAYGLGEDPSKPYSFQVLDFSTGSDPRLLSVSTLNFNEATGLYTATTILPQK